MILSEFVLTHTIGKTALDTEYFADVSVTTGHWWWKKTERKKIHRPYAGYWRFLDTGEFTPDSQAQNLEYAYEAKEKLYKYAYEAKEKLSKIVESPAKPEKPQC